MNRVSNVSLFVRTPCCLIFWWILSLLNSVVFFICSFPYFLLSSFLNIGTFILFFQSQDIFFSLIILLNSIVRSLVCGSRPCLIYAVRILSRPGAFLVFKLAIASFTIWGLIKSSKQTVPSSSEGLFGCDWSFLAYSFLKSFSHSFLEIFWHCMYWLISIFPYPFLSPVHVVFHIFIGDKFVFSLLPVILAPEYTNA